jgi:hypothetical protein
MALGGDRIRLLSMVDVFESLSTEEIERLDERLPDAHLETGDIFYSPTIPSEKVFILRRGKARIYKWRTTVGSSPSPWWAPVRCSGR